MVEDLRQGVREDATDFMIGVGTSIGNLEEELQSLQYEVSLNGVREEI